MDIRIPGKYFKELEAGQDFTYSPVEITDHMIQDFSRLTGDFNLLHLNEEFSAGSHFKSRICPGMLTASLAIAPLGDETFNGTAIAMIESDWKYHHPVRIGDTLRRKATVASKHPRGEGYESGKVIFHIEVVNQRAETVLTGDLTVLIK
jgi:acyl dehydratase